MNNDSKTNTLAKAKSRVMAKLFDTTSSNETVSRYSVAVIGLAAGLIGLWAIACLMGATAGGNGPLGLISNWVSAVIGQ